MLTKTTETGIHALIYLACIEKPGPVSPRLAAKNLGVSPSYLLKIMALLVRAGILQAHRGAKGGVTLGRKASSISLLDVVQGLQGIVPSQFCQEVGAQGRGCAFHDAMKELHDSTVAILKRWTLQDLVDRPYVKHSKQLRYACLMSGLWKDEPQVQREEVSQ